MRWWILVAAAAVLIVAGLFVATKFSQGTVKTSDPVSTLVASAEDAGAACPDVDILPGKMLASADTTPVLLMGDSSARFFLDDSPVTSTAVDVHRFPAGDHVLRIELPPLEPAQIKIHFEPFAPGLVEVQGDGPTVTVMLQTASCAGCGTTMTNIDTSAEGEPQPDALDASARALRSGDWRAAATALKGVSEADRKKSRFNRQLAVLSALAGRPTEGRRLLENAKDDFGKSFRAAIDALTKVEAAEPARESNVALDRWNALTDRFTRVADKFGADAPGSVGAASSRFNQLSEGFSKAREKNDLIEQEGTVETATEVFRTFVKELRQIKPTDCTWQARITAAQ